MDSMIYSFIIFLFNLDCTNSLKLTHLHVPQSIHRGESTWLNCSYDPGFDKIYSIKWYKNDVEFYRYLPTEKPSIQYYPSSGISIDVSKSVSANVYLTESTFQTEGLYRCEVSADAPSFQTVAREKHLKVYYLPEAGPTIEPIKWSYYRDYPVIDLICKSNPSKPSTQLTWLIDNQPSPEQYLSHNVTHNPSGLEVTRLRLTLPYQYGSLVNQFDLRCESRFLLTHVDQLQLTIRSNFFKPQSEDNSQSDNFPDDQITKTFNLTIYQDVESNILVKGYQLMYKINDLVNLICQVVKSRAHHKTKPTLKWLINNEEALADMTEAYQNEDFGEYTSRLGFNLSDRFFNMWSTFDNKIGPKIVFKCVAIHEEVLFRSGKDFIPDLQNNVISSARESTHSTNSGSIFRIDKMLTIGPLAITFAFYFMNFKNLFLCLLKVSKRILIIFT